MHVRMKQNISGTRNGLHWPRMGELTELPDQEAADLCAAGLAEPVEAPVERAVPPAPEKRAAPRRARKPKEA